MIDDTFDEIDQLERLFADEGDDADYSNLESGSNHREENFLNADFHRKSDLEKPVNKTGETSSFKEKPTVKKEEKKIDAFFQKSSAFTDPVFGLRIVNPLVSSKFLLERMEGRTPIGFSRVRAHVEQGDRSKDWVIAGVIISKAVRESQKGKKYTLWKLSDLRHDMKTISVFLFKNAHSDLWKTPEATVVGILNPGIMDRKDEKDQAVLSVDNAQKIMIMGISKDLGRCKSKKKNGEACTALVNITDCEYCVFHVKQEYNNASKRAGLQSATAGRGLNELRNKVLGKSEVFYAGQSYTAIPAKKNPKLVAKDQHRLMTLSEYYQSPNAGNSNAGPGGSTTGSSTPSRSTPQNSTSNSTTPGGSRNTTPNSITPVGAKKYLPDTKPKISQERHDTNVKQRQKDLQRLALLRSESENNPPTDSTPTSSSPSTSSFRPQFSSKLSQAATPKSLPAAPKLSGGSFTVDLSMTSKQAERAKQKAIELLKKRPIEKIDPNMVKHRGTESGKKRALEELNKSLEDTESKRIKLDKETAKRERLVAIMNAKSAHQDLADFQEMQRQEKYFNLLEKKEAMEDKMMNTSKIECKAVICLKCKYASFSAAERCKNEGHPLKVKDAMKRFFKCKDCGNRTVTLQRLPKLPCKNCNGTRWEKTTMMKEKDVKIGEQLSIRGDEEMFIGNVQGNLNINLLVPEENN